MNRFTQTLRTILSGDAVKYVIRYRRFFSVSFILALLYISNGLVFGLINARTKELEAEMLKSRARYNIRLEEINVMCRYPNLLELLKKHNRSDLQTAKEPPLMLEKPLTFEKNE